MQFPQVVFQSIESVLHDLPKRLHPGIHRLKRFGPKPVDPAVPIGLRLQNSAIAKYLQMLRGLGLTQPQPVSDFTHGERTIAQELDDV